jgi:hypothetical protein
VVDLAKLPALEVLGAAELVNGEPFAGSAEAVWPKADVLVWVTQQANYWWGWADVAWGGPGLIRGMPWGPWMPWGSGEAKLYALNVNSASTPQLLSQVSLTSSNGWANFSKPFVADNAVFLSRQFTETTITGTNYMVTTNIQDVVDSSGSGTGGSPGDSADTKPEPVGDSTTPPERPSDPIKIPVVVTNEIPIYVSKQITFLEVIDYTAPASPVQRQPVTIPGTLRGLSHNGALLYLVGYKFDTESVTDGQEWLHACAYDGVAATLVASQPLPVEWPHALLVHDARIFITRPESEKTGPRALEIWTLAETGQFVKANERNLASNATLLHAVGDVLIVQEEMGLEIFDLPVPGEAPVAAADSPVGCIGWNLEMAAGSKADGLWLPMDVYGLYHIDLVR